MGIRNLRLRTKSKKLRSKSRKLRTRKLRIKSRKLRTRKLRTRKLRTRKLRTKSRKLRTKYIKNNALNKGGSIHGRALIGCNSGQLNLLEWFDRVPSTILKLMVINEDNGYGISRQPLIYGYVNTPGLNSEIPCVIVQMWLTNEHGEIPHAQTQVEYITFSKVGPTDSGIVEQLDALWSKYFETARVDWAEGTGRSKSYVRGLINIRKDKSIGEVFVDLVKKADSSSNIHSGRCNIHDFCVNPYDITYTCSNFVIVFGGFSYHALLYWINQLTPEQLKLECMRSEVEIAGEMDTRANLFLKYYGYETTKQYYTHDGPLATQCDSLYYPQELVYAVIERAHEVGIEKDQLRWDLRVDVEEDAPPVTDVGYVEDVEDVEEYSPVTVVGEGPPVLVNPPQITEDTPVFDLPEKLIAALKLHRNYVGRITLLNDYNSSQEARLSDTDIEKIAHMYQ